MMLLSMSIRAGMLILLILLLRSLIQKKLPKKLFAALWVLVLFRLLVPVNIPVNFPEGWEDSLRLSLNRPENIPEGNHASDWQLNVSGIQTNSDENAAYARVLDGKDIFLAWLRNAYRPWFKIVLTPVWLTGVLLLACIFCRQYRRDWRRICDFVPPPFPDLQNWAGKRCPQRRVKVMISDHIGTPLTCRILNPVILLPKALLQSDFSQIKYVMEHEMTHIRHWDNLWKLLAAAAVCIHWFNPLVWVMYFLFDRDLEFACDEAVLDHFKTDERSEYALALVDLTQQRAGFSCMYHGFAKRAVQERVVMIMKYRKTTWGARCAAALIFTSAMTVFAGEAPADPAAEAVAELYAIPAGGYGDRIYTFHNEDLRERLSQYQDGKFTYMDGTGIFSGEKILLYDGKPVREIMDEEAGWRYYFQNGSVDLTPEYGADGSVTCIKVLSRSEYAKRTIVLEKYEAILRAADGIDETVYEEEPFREDTEVDDGGKEAAVWEASAADDGAEKTPGLEDAPEDSSLCYGTVVGYGTDSITVGPCNDYGEFRAPLKDACEKLVNEGKLWRTEAEKILSQKYVRGKGDGIS